jgi:glycerol-3-phosphate acyltransferase PlsY
MTLWKGIAAILAAYLLGSVPTALLYSKLTQGMDIRELGDGNMGARNSKRQFGWRAGVFISLADIIKGALAVQLAVVVGLPEVWNYLCGAFVVLGHDFPIFAKFKGGQGFATTTGVFLSLFPGLTLIGFVIYVIAYFTMHIADVASSLGMGFIAAATWYKGGSLATIGFIVLLLLFIPIKTWLDRGRMTVIQERERRTGN